MDDGRWTALVSSMIYRLSSSKFRSDYHIHPLAGHDDHLAHRLAVDEALHALVAQRPLAHLGLVGLGRHVDLAAHLAVDLQHQLDLVLHKGGFVPRGPGGMVDAALTAK